jgi:group I intron endonuclease
MGWIYKVTNTKNGKIYIGQTREEKVETRWNDHRSGRGHAPLLKNSISKWGIDIFNFEVVHDVPNEELNSREIEEISINNCISPNGYNIKKGGDNHEVHEDTRRKISESTRGEKHWNFGRKEPSDVCRRKSESLKGNKNPNFGKITPDSTKKLISLALSGENNKNFGKFGGLHNRSKKVEQLQNGTWVFYSSIAEAAQQTNTSRDGISKCCNGTIKYSGGYKWRWFQIPVEPNP